MAGKAGRVVNHQATVAAKELRTVDVAGARKADVVEGPHAVIQGQRIRRLRVCSDALVRKGSGAVVYRGERRIVDAVGGLLDDEALGRIRVVAIPGKVDVRAIMIVAIDARYLKVARRPRGEVPLLLGVRPVQNVLEVKRPARAGGEAHISSIPAHERGDVDGVACGEDRMREEILDPLG